MRFVQEPDAEKHAVGAGKGCAWGLLVDVEIELGKRVAVGAGLTARGKGRNAGDMAGEFADAVLVGCGLEGLGGRAEAAEGVEGGAWTE